MQRREIITFLGAAALIGPLTARAQLLKKMPRVGVLWHAGSAEEEEVYLSALRKGFAGRKGTGATGRKGASSAR